MSTATQERKVVPLMVNCKRQVNPYRRCGCRAANGKTLGKLCPELAADPKHGTWGFSLSAGTDAAGKRIQIRKIGFRTEEDAMQAAAERLNLWENLTRVDGCVEGTCRKWTRHGECADCGSVTDSTGIRIDASSLRRVKVFLCTNCYLSPRASAVREQRRLMKKRTGSDWERVTDPIAGEMLAPDIFHEQYDSATRRALRAFMDSGFDTATVPNIASGTLNASAAALGLSGSIYAETRAGESVLRRIPE